RLDPPGELLLLVGRQEPDLADLLEVHAHRIEAAALTPVAAGLERVVEPLGRRAARPRAPGLGPKRLLPVQLLDDLVDPLDAAGAEPFLDRRELGGLGLERRKGREHLRRRHDTAVGACHQSIESGVAERVIAREAWVGHACCSTRLSTHSEVVTSGAGWASWTIHPTNCTAAAC